MLQEMGTPWLSRKRSIKAPGERAATSVHTSKTPIRRHYIYGLVDPLDGAIRYVGRTCNPRQRLSRHRQGKSLTAKGGWIRELAIHEMRPDMYILEVIDPDEQRLIYLAREAYGYRNKKAQSPEALETVMDGLVSTREEWWIELARLLGWPILNTKNEPSEPVLMHQLTSDSPRQRIELR
jgi:hypothetical protein